MAIFKLQQDGGPISEGQLVEATRSRLELEAHLEAWLERSPWAIAEEALVVVGRQTTARSDSGASYPDLLGLDADGSLVIVEFKKGRTPREVVAQILEYAAWANDLSQEELHEIAEAYLRQHGAGQTLAEAFCETFEVDELPVLNQRLRLFIAAEEIHPAVARVCRFLRSEHGLDVHCVEFRVHETEGGEILINSNRVVGQEEVASRRAAPSGTGSRWSGDQPVKRIVWEAAQRIAKKSPVFAPKDVRAEVLREFPDFNKSTVGCQIMSDCVNHASRHHYPGGEDRYWWVEKGRYELYDPEKHQPTPQAGEKE